jgi:thiol-disulfide isomerase/thioredoxin
MSKSIFYCKNCGRAIFKSEHIIEKVNLWDLRDYQAECYMVSQAVDMKNLRRYDASLHEGWYCCRFIMMRMIVDKFGTGRNLLIYADSVVEYPDGKTPKLVKEKHAQIKLTKKDFDNVIKSGNSNKLMVVKLGAIWCPPCRLMDTVISQIREKNSLPDVDFFEVDIDEEQEISSRYRNMAIPYILFFYNGKKIEISSNVLPTVDGGIIGGLNREVFEQVCKLVLNEAKSGRYVIQISV